MCLLPAKVNGKTQGFPAAGPDVVVQERFMSAAAVVVPTVVVLAVVVVDIVLVVGLVVVDAVVEVSVAEVVVEAPGQVEEHTDSEPRIWVPFSLVLVLHQGDERRSVEAQEL